MIFSKKQNLFFSFILNPSSVRSLDPSIFAWIAHEYELITSKKINSIIVNNDEASLSTLEKAFPDRLESVFIGFEEANSANWIYFNNIGFLTSGNDAKVSNFDIQGVYSESCFIKFSELGVRLSREFQLDYGYGDRYPGNFIGERNVSRSLFGRVAQVTEDDIYWERNACRINEGLLKSVYRVNYLNNSQLQNLSLLDLTSAFGQLETYGRLARWTLSIEEKEEILSLPQTRGAILI